MIVANGSSPVKHSEAEVSEICFLCSKKYLKSINGNSGLIQVAKSLKANSIIVIDDNSETFSIVEDLSGKLLYVNFLANDLNEDSIHDYGLHLVATLAENNQFIAGDERTEKLVNLARKVAKTDVTVFINGPTGTGKEVLSKFIHNNSGRCNITLYRNKLPSPFQKICWRLYFLDMKKGAFTGASSPNKGIFPSNRWWNTVAR